MTGVSDHGVLSIVDGKWGRLLVPRNDTVVSRSLRRHGTWCEGEIDLLRRYLTLHSTVIDVGAFVGSHALAFSRLAGRVVCLEPQRPIFSLLEVNLLLNGCANVEALNVAASDEIGSLRLPMLDMGTRQNTAAFAVSAQAPDDAQRYEVPALPIDTLAQQVRFDLLKIDVEGAEEAVIAGAAKCIGAYRPVIYFENNVPHYRAGLFDMLRDLGYRCWWHFSWLHPGATTAEVNCLALSGDEAPEDLHEVAMGETCFDAARRAKPA